MKKGQFEESLELEAVQASVSKVIGTVGRLLLEADCPDDARRQIFTAVDEVCSNIVDYAYPGGTEGAGGKSSGTGTLAVDITVDVDARTATISLRDHGIPFNPLTMEDPVLGQPSENGGLGIFITKAVMSAVTYSYADGKNCLTLTKSW